MTWHKLAAVSEIDRVPAEKEKNVEYMSFLRWLNLDLYVLLALEWFADFHWYIGSGL